MSATGSDTPSATMSAMTPPRHARQPWTFFQFALACACSFLGTAIIVLGFTDIYLSVTHLLAAWWGSWAWTVIVLGEGMGLAVYLGWLLLDLRARPAPRTRLFLAAYLSGCAAVSLALMLYAGRAGAPDLLSHGLVSAAFFGFLVFAKVMVRRLATDPEAMVMEQAVADARRYAIDLLRDRKGMWWRWRPSVPSLLRRQVLSGRLPAAVVTAVRDSLREYGGPWEQEVRSWVLGAEGLNLSVQAEQASRKAVSDITREAAPEPPASVPETVPASVHERPAAAPVRERARARTKPAPRRMSDDQLMPFARDALAADPGLSAAGMRRATGTGPERAKALLARAQAEARQQRMKVAK